MIVLVVVKFCFKSTVTVVFAAIVTVVNSDTPSSASVNVALVAAVFATIILVTTAVVNAGTV